MPMVCQAIEEVVRGRIVRKPFRTPHRCARGKQHEMIQPELARQHVQVPRAGNLGVQVFDQCAHAQVGQRLHPHDTGRMEDATEGGPRLAERIDERIQGDCIGNVGRDDIDGDPFRLQLVNHGGNGIGVLTLGAQRIQVTPPHQDEMSGTVVGEPARNLQTEPAEPARDQVGAVVLELQLAGLGSRAANQPGNETLAIPDRDLVFVIAGLDLREQFGGVALDIDVRVEIDDPAPAFRPFERCDATEAPERTCSQVRGGIVRIDRVHVPRH